MESFSEESFSLSYWDYFTFLFLRPFAAVLFSLSLLFFGWFLAWKLVLVHVPLVQEIFGLREKLSSQSLLIEEDLLNSTTELMPKIHLQIEW